MSDNHTGTEQSMQIASAVKTVTREPMLSLYASLLISAPFTGYCLANALGSAIGLAVGLSGMFLLAFTGSPTPARMGWMVRYCYFFCFLAVATAIVPFFLLDASLEGSSHMNKVSDKTSIKGMQHSLNEYLSGNKAIGVVVGCRMSGDPQPYVDCGKSGFQWVVHIGGTLHKAPVPGTQSEAKRYAGQVAAPAFRHADFRLPAAGMTSQASTMDGAVRVDESQLEPKRYYVEGGIVFPLYLIVISLIGGAVSLTRRVPVMQCHLWENMQALSMDKRYKIRQDLILQMMQFVSAPFVAVIAFSVLEPTSMALAVGGAFLSGFASEYVLLTISNLFDKLKPEAARKAG